MDNLAIAIIFFIGGFSFGAMTQYKASLRHHHNYEIGLAQLTKKDTITRDELLDYINIGPKDKDKLKENDND